MKRRKALLVGSALQWIAIGDGPGKALLFGRKNSTSKQHANELRPSMNNIFPSKGQKIEKRSL